MKKNIFNLLGGVLLSLPMLFASCGNGDNALEEIINGGGSGGGTPVTPEEIIYAFSLCNMADDADITAGLFKLTDQTGTEIAYATSDGKYTIKADDLSSVTTLWLEVTSNEDKKYIAKATVEELPAIAEAGKLKMATLGDVILSDGKFAAAEATGAVAKICYLGSETGEAAPYNHGLALAMSDANSGSFFKWKTTKTDAGHTPQTSSTFTEESGLQYNSFTPDHNTSDYPAFKAAITYSPAAPTGCSAWFLASGYQWNQMLGANGYGLANLKATANGYTGLSGYYWSSTEYDASQAWDFNSNDGNCYKVYKDDSYRVRACLAF